jgi:hypothetical protein
MGRRRRTSLLRSRVTFLFTRDLLWTPAQDDPAGRSGLGPPVRLSAWLRGGGSIVTSLAVGLVTTNPQAAQAQEASRAASFKELQQEIQRLRRRVETLERRAAPELAPPETAPPAQQKRKEVAAPAAPAARPAEIGAIEATEEEVERALERALVQTGALLLPAGAVEIEPSFSYVRQETDAPVFFTEAEVQSLATAEVQRDILSADLTLRLGLPLESQVELDIPYQYENQATVTRVGFATRQEQSRDASGVGDVGVAFSKSLLRERGWQPDLIGRVRWDTDTGETVDDVFLGSGFHEISGAVTAVKTQDPLVFVGSVSYLTSFEDRGVDPGDELGFSIGTLLAASPETSLRFFLNQSFADDVKIDGREIPGSDEDFATFTTGASSILSARVLLDLTAGIGLTDETSDYFVNVSLPIRF